MRGVEKDKSEKNSEDMEIRGIEQAD